MKICVVTSVPAAREPRAPRHAIAAKEAFPNAHVLFMDMAAQGASEEDPRDLLCASGVIRQTIEYPARKHGFVALAMRKGRVRAARFRMRATGAVAESVFGAPMIGLTRHLKRARADLYLAHNIETLLPASLAVESCGAHLIFDCMEYYSDMGAGQTSEEAAAARKMEATWLPRCDLVTASSDALADALCRQYGIRRPLPLYNTPKVNALLPNERCSGIRLYWRNAVVGFGQRGLEDVLVAMTRLPEDITLAIQGRPASDGGQQVLCKIQQLGLAKRVTLLPPYAPGDAVSEAAKHSVGLCLERRGPANHEYTVSNKLFDYMMAGLAVVSSDLPSLRSVVRRADCGLLFEPGSVDHLTAQIARLYSKPDLLAEFRAKSRKFALAEGNVEVDMARFKAALLGVVTEPERWLPTAALA